MKRLVLIDGNALLHRAYHATPPLTTPKGELVNAVYGFSSMLLKALDELHPEYIAVTWDLKAPTFRHVAYENYKATRKQADDALSGQYERVYEVVRAFNIPEFKLPGFEADDLIGALTRQAEKEKDLEIVLVTGDRDIMQLIDKKVKVFMPRKTLSDVGMYGEEEFVARFGFMPKSLPDYKGLAGDSSDNIPGVKGVGDVSATKLISKYSTLEKVYQNLKNLPERLQKLLEEGKDSAFMSRKLATIETEIPINLDLQKCIVHDFDYEKVKNLFEELEFKSLISRIPAVILGSGATPESDSGQARMTKESINQKNKEQPLFAVNATSALDKEVEPVLKKMSEAGILVDLKFLASLSKDLNKQLEDSEQQIYSIIGHEINLNSPKQLSQVLFDELKLPVIRKTKTGRSTDEETLTELNSAHPVIPLLLKYRQLFKLISTYIDALPKSVGKDARIHSTFNVEGASTGRLSSQNPNLQNIPVKGELGGEIRKAFIAPKGKILLAADYSQIELRILAHLCDDPNLKEAFNKGLDIHSLTAAKIFNVPIEQVTHEQRRVGKTMNFATLYGQGAYALSRQLGIDHTSAQTYIDEYFDQFPMVKIWKNNVVDKAKEVGFVETLWGRKRFIPEIQADNRRIQAFGERAAVNMPVQGCLPWETKILTSWGYIPIGELYIAKKKPPFVWDGSEWKSYTVLDRGEAQLAQIKFSNGQIFKCDVRHKVLTVNEDSYEWKEFSDLKPGIKVCFSMPTIHEFSSKPFSYGHTPKVHNGLPLRLTLNKEFWYWLGYYIGDGYLHKRWNRAWVYSLTYFFGEHEKEKLEQCIKFFTSLGLHPTKRKASHRPKVKLSTRYSITIHSQGLGKCLEVLGLPSGKNAHTKCLPPRIFTESLEHRCMFIKGIMDSDGYYGIKENGSPNIHLCQGELLQEIQLLLKTLGVDSRIRGPYVYKDRISYRLDIHRSALIQALNQGEKSRFDRYLSGMVPQFLVQEAIFLGSHLQKTQFATSSDYVLYSRWKNGGSSSLYHFQTWLKRNNIVLQIPIYHFNEIVEIEKLDQFETTYTLSVPSSHRFDSEGVISKNTAADMIKKAMVEIEKEFTGDRGQDTDNRKKPYNLQPVTCNLILQVHDELLFECSPNNVQETGKMIKEKMEKALKLSVPVVVDLKIGKNWGEMKKMTI